jgi:spore germination cell wall hydrolase CwlJ-like protein
MTAAVSNGPVVPTTARASSSRVNLLLGGVAAVALAVPVMLVLNAPDIAPEARRAARPQRVVSATELPPVEPTSFAALAPEDARVVNATVGFSTEPNPAARPFRFVGAPEDLARATDCLAAAVIYEAGDDAVGERAVAQVVLNRVRHPAYPKTVCGVVFQGQERSTGCQFTFTCDGAISRQPSEGGWRRAREIAAAALAGSVFPTVGHATHYHTDWVVPYWSSSLDKIVAVGTHLFFRWTGWWGTPPAFNRSRQGPEPAYAKLAYLSEAHRGGRMLIGADPTAIAGAAITGPAPIPVASQNDSFLLTLPRGLPADFWPTMAVKACGDRVYCKVLAWTDASRTPGSLPLSPAQIGSLSFSYLRDRADGYEKTLWNCRETKRADPLQCMKQQVFQPATTSEAPTTGVTPPRGPDELDGVRRKWTDAAVPFLPKAEPTKTPAPASTP